MHTQQLHTTDGLQNQNVLVVGVGNSAMDAATTFAPVSKSVTISTRRGTWVWGRIARWGLPYDIYYLTKWYKLLFQLMPPNIVNAYIERLVNRKVDHELYGLRPKHRFNSAHPTLNDALPNLMCSGQLTVKGDIKRFTSNSVIFDDDAEKEIDIVILGTGYKFGYPFLQPQSLVPIQDNDLDVYKYVFPTTLQKQTLAIIGLIQPIGSISPISEIQARWAARVFAGRVSLPSIVEQQADIDNKRRTMRARYVHSPRHTIQVDYLYYMDEIAELIDCRLTFLGELMRTGNPTWLMQLYFGPYYPYYFRLKGPHSWAGAEEAIKTARERVCYPMHQRVTSISNKNRQQKSIAMLAAKMVTSVSAFLFIGFCLSLIYLFAMKIGVNSPWLFVGLSCSTVITIGIVLMALAFFFDISILF